MLKRALASRYVTKMGVLGESLSLRLRNTAIIISILAFSTTMVAGEPRAQECGEVLKANITLTKDLTCKKDGLKVAVDGIVIDLGGHTIKGPGRGRWTWPGPGRASVGIEAKGVKDVTIRNGAVKGFATSILIDDSRGFTVETMKASNSLFGLYIQNSARGKVLKNEIGENTYGIHLSGSSNNLLSRNRMAKNHYQSPGGYGIYLFGSNENIITENEITSNENQGLWLSASRRNRIFKNIIDDNDPNAVDDTADNLWHDEDAKRGNYWDDYEGSDKDGDGVGDEPYTIRAGGAKDLYPLIRRPALGKRG